jgi:hypothetical protein
MSKASPGKSGTLPENQTNAESAGFMAQEEEHLPSKLSALSSTPSTSPNINE